MDLSRRGPDSDALFRRAVPDFFARGDREQRVANVAAGEAGFRAALCATNTNVGLIGPALAAWVSAAHKPTSKVGALSELDLVAGLGIIVGLHLGQNWEHELIVCEVKRQATISHYEL